MTLQKLLFDIFHVTILRFSNITLIVFLSISKMVRGITYKLLTACLTAQQVNQTIIVAIKAMVYLINLFSCKAIEIVGKLDT